MIQGHYTIPNHDDDSSISQIGSGLTLDRKYKRIKEEEQERDNDERINQMLGRVTTQNDKPSIDRRYYENPLIVARDLTS